MKSCNEKDIAQKIIDSVGEYENIRGMNLGQMVSTMACTFIRKKLDTNDVEKIDNPCFKIKQNEINCHCNSRDKDEFCMDCFSMPLKSNCSLEELNIYSLFMIKFFRSVKRNVNEIRRKRLSFIKVKKLKLKIKNKK
jgi:hypothetical protein